MKIAFLMTLTLLSTILAFSNEHALGAHEHGTVKLGMAIEKNVVELDIDGPSESFISFEYQPQTEKEKKIFKEAKDLWEKNVLALITFDKKLNCKITQSSFKQEVGEEEHADHAKDHKKHEAVHSDIEAKAKITCSGDLVGTDVQISLKKRFKNMKKLTVDIISANTKSVEITKDVQIIKI